MRTNCLSGGSEAGEAGEESETRFIKVGQDRPGQG